MHSQKCDYKGVGTYLWKFDYILTLHEGLFTKCLTPTMLDPLKKGSLTAANSS